MCFIQFRRICHWGPLTALGIIKLVTASSIYCSNMIWPRSTIFGAINSTVFITFSGMTLYNFLSSMFHGPGYLPLNWKPSNEEDCNFLQKCGVCCGYKAPRSHHCRKCGRCVLKMDHHCPWINNCVGWSNHAHFTFFLLFATLGCLHASIILFYALYRSIHRAQYMTYGSSQQPVFFLGLKGVITCVFSLGFSIGVVIAVGMLLFVQLRGIIRNRTCVEDWIMEKANFRWRNSPEKFLFPYDLGIRQNIREVLNLTCHPVGNGIYFSVREGCDQFTLTKEQIEQKSQKRLKTKLYTIIRPATGSWCPITFGLKVLFNFPCTDEPRIKLEKDDNVMVTRWRKHWLFGEKVQQGLSETERSLLRTRGWFPRKCAVEVVENNDDRNHSETSKKNE